MYFTLDQRKLAESINVKFNYFSCLYIFTIYQLYYLFLFKYHIYILNIYPAIEFVLRFKSFIMKSNINEFFMRKLN